MSETYSDGPTPERESDIQKFLDEYKMIVNRKKKRSLMEMTFTSFESFKLGVRISHCCKDMDLDGAYKYYLEAKALEAKPTHSTFSNLLSLVAGLGEQGSGCAQIRLTEPPHNIDAAFVVYKDMKSAEFPMHESIYSALIRCCSMHDRAEDALTLYRELQAQSIAPKLRTFTPLFTVFAKKLDDVTTYSIYDEMVQQYSITPTEREYAILLRLATTKRDTARFHSLFTALREDIPVPAGTEVWDAIKQWFMTVETAYTVATSDVAADGQISAVPGGSERLASIDLSAERTLELQSQLDSFAVLRDDGKRFKPNNKIKVLMKNKQLAAAAAVIVAAGAGAAGETKVDDTSAAIMDVTAAAAAAVSVPESSAVSAAVSFEHTDTVASDDASSVVAATVEPTTNDDVTMTETTTTTTEAVTTNTSTIGAAGKENKKRSHQHAFDDEMHRQAKWAHFKKWLTADGRNFDVIVDGANVGYYKQNYAGAPNHVDYHQIDQLLRHLKSLGHRPLLILHCRHLFKEMIPSEEVAAMTRRWDGGDDSGLMMYLSPKGFNDDWFWIYAAVAHNCKIVTNDLMRDHHFQMLSPKWFSQWKERHQVKFEFGPWQKVVVDNATTTATTSTTVREKEEGKEKESSSVTPVAVVATDSDVIVNTASDTATTTIDAAVAVESTITITTAVTSAANAAAATAVVPPVSSTYIQAGVCNNWRQRCTREVELKWPRLYSYCIQHIVSERYEGFYCPPPAAEEEQEEDEGDYDGDEEQEESGSVHSRESAAAGVAGVGFLHPEDSEYADYQDMIDGKWLCAYRLIDGGSDVSAPAAAEKKAV